MSPEFLQKIEKFWKNSMKLKNTKEIPVFRLNKGLTRAFVLN